ncbi:MAG: amidase [Acidimicrobiia bacterium]|nr:amidase [Acidimicrobiia bacterium]
MADGLRGVVELATLITSRELTATEVVADHLRRAEASQSELNAFTLIDADRAMEAAAEIDASLDSGAELGPLAGVPIATKDLIDHAGRPNTRGSSFPPTVPEVTAPAIARLEAAGAVVIGRTGLHEFAFGFSSENHWFGPVRNPWDRSLSPGGSSGGSGSAVAAGLAAAALGTDTGGSVRVPAALCGAVGLKVTHGRVPLTGVYPLAASIDTVGPLARSVADAAAVYQLMAGDDPDDPWSAPHPVVVPQQPADLTALTIGIPHPWIDQTATDEVRTAFDTAIAAIADAGATVVDLELPVLDPPGLMEAAMYPEVAAVHRRNWQESPERYGPDVHKRMEAVFDFTMDDLLEGRRWQQACHHEASRAFARCDVLATPTVAALRKPIGVEEIEVAGEMVSYRGPLSRFTALVNHIRGPALALPLPLSGEGPPPSLQLIGPHWSEDRLLAIGLALEDAGIVGYTQPPG